jgi:hypothetical protein
MIKLARVGVEVGDRLDCGGKDIGERLLWMVGDLDKQSCSEPGDIPCGAWRQPISRLSGTEAPSSRITTLSVAAMRSSLAAPGAGRVAKATCMASDILV